MTSESRCQPNYVRIYDELEAWIRTEAAPGAKLRSESELGRHYGVNRQTVRRVLEELGRVQLIRTHHGRGSYVREKPSRYRVATGGNASLSEEMRRTGHRSESRLLDRRWEVRTPPEAGFDPLESSWLVRTLRLIDGEPWSVTRTWLRSDLPGITREQWPERGSLHAMLLEECGIRMVRRNRVFGALAADGETSRLLKCDRGNPILSVRGVNVDAHTMRPVAYVEHHYAGAAVEFETELL